MELIVAVDKQWAIGKENQSLVNIPADLRYFREMTKNHVVIMGRKTLETLPNKRPLPERKNIIISRKASYQVNGAKVVHSIEDAMCLAVELKKKVESDRIFVIGGGSIYQQMLPYCDTAYVTKIEYTYEADTFFPNLDQMKEWSLVEKSEEQTYYDLEYYFTVYKKGCTAERGCRLGLS